jgi:hypothetical protein
VHASSDAIFLTHPLYRALSGRVDIIHTREPLQDDDVTFNSDYRVGNQPGFDVVRVLVSLAETRPSVVDELLPLSKDFGEPFDTALVGVSSDESAAGSRVTHDTWSEYANLRREGDPGGPQPISELHRGGVGLKISYSHRPLATLWCSIPCPLRFARPGRQRHSTIFGSSQPISDTCFCSSAIHSRRSPPVKWAIQ